jgi:hypothetical protein
MDEQIMVRKASEDDGEKVRWSLVVGSDVVVAIRTADTLPKERAVEYLFRELVRDRQ